MKRYIVTTLKRLCNVEIEKEIDIDYPPKSPL